MNPHDVAGRCATQLPQGYLADNEPVFSEPWQAQAFSLAVHLIESGKISWQQWAQALGEEIAGAAAQGIAEDGSGYYELWLRALEKLVTDANLVQENELAELEAAWRQAYLDTPHGQPVQLADSAASR